MCYLEGRVENSFHKNSATSRKKLNIPTGPEKSNLTFLMATHYSLNCMTA